jgi:tRNA(Arg) A34 adenosine deaminase TadA
MPDLLRAERDAIASVGLLARTYFMFDPPIDLGAGANPTHFRGLNVHCFVIDNTDGELIAAERNMIHAEESPIQHAEQRALRAAIERIRQKRPRQPNTTVEEYYKRRMFMDDGSSEEDYVRRGCTLYNAFDPCAMCAVTLLIASMKRIAYVVEDLKFAGFYQEVKGRYFSSRQSSHGKVDPGAVETQMTVRAANLLNVLNGRVSELLTKKIDLINVLDNSRDILSEAANFLQSLSASDLNTTGVELVQTTKTLSDVKRACGLTA